MKKYIFKDILTEEEFEIICYPYEVHNIELNNLELQKFCEGSILNRLEFDL